MSVSEKNCFLCGQPANCVEIFVRDMWQFQCTQCGKYKISDDLANDWSRRRVKPEDRERYLLSAVVREITETRPSDDPVELLTTTKSPLLSRAPNKFDIAARARKLLAAISRRTDYAGELVRLSFESDYPLAFGPPGLRDDFAYIFLYLIHQGWVNEHVGGGFKVKIAPEGWEILSHAETLDSSKAFVAMWIDEEVDDAYQNGIHPSIESTGFQPVRIDAKEYNGGIVDQILAEINESRFVIADLTGHRPGVYHEAGYAMGLGLPVIWTCREDQADGTHFDTKHLNQIRWDSPEELEERLRNRIRATIGKGPLK